MMSRCVSCWLSKAEGGALAELERLVDELLACGWEFLERERYPGSRKLW